MDYEVKNSGDFEKAFYERMQTKMSWSQPEMFELSNEGDRERITQLIDEGRITSVIDEIDLIANDAHDLMHPSEKEDADHRRRFIEGIKNEGLSFGNWFYMPWTQRLVRYPDKHLHRELRTFRNRNLITKEEQSKLFDSKIAVFGLSVGSKVVEQLVSSGIGGTFIIGDPDIIKPSNLNRISGGFLTVGTNKLDKTAGEISEIDPYINQVHFPSGITSEDFEKLGEIHPNIIFDEVDDLKIKAEIRDFARKNAIPVVMATDLGDRSIIDVERYDNGDARPFGGRLKADEFEKLIAGNIDKNEIRRFMLKIVGVRHITTRMLESVLEIDKTLAGLPQLGDTASIGGAMSAKAAREIILQRQLKSGRYVHNPNKSLGLSPQSTVSGSLRVIGEFIKTTRTK